MAAATNYAEERILRHFLGITATTIPASISVHLHTADPTEVGTTAEVTGGSYAPQSSPTMFTWDAGNSNAENTSAIEFTGMPAVTVSHWSISDGTNRLFKGSFTTSRTLSAGDTFRINAGDLQISAD